MNLNPACVFCKIIKGEIPSLKLYESAKTLAFLDIQPTASAHALVIPKYHGAKLHDVPDEYLADLLPVAKRLAIAAQLDTTTSEGAGYNILQNNGRIAHQMVDHVHVHMIPKRDSGSGLIVGWPQDEAAQKKLTSIQQDLLSKIN